MTEREEKDMARRLASDSEVFDFDRALEVVRRRPADAERLLSRREERERREEEQARGRERRRQALIEDFF
jgi:hypothetical protein